jgi:hypothetical protein
MAGSVAAVGWKAEASRGPNRALDDRRTTGGRYHALASLHPWLTLTLERRGLSWESALILGESLTRPPLDWFDIEQVALNGAGLRPVADLPRLRFDTDGQKEHVLKASRHLAMTVLSDLGADRASAYDSAPSHRDERARILWAGQRCDVTRSTTDDPKGALQARDAMRRLLHALGGWPWSEFEGGRLPGGWWEVRETVSAFVDWCHIGEMTESLARHHRADALRAPERFAPPPPQEPVNVSKFIEAQDAMLRAHYAAGDLSVEELNMATRWLRWVAAGAATPPQFLTGMRHLERLRRLDARDAAAA